MDFVSTRGGAPACSASQAILQGLATDGGLYVPTSLPLIEEHKLASVSSYPELAFEVLAPFFEDDSLRKDLAEICMDAFDFPVVMHDMDSNHTILELFHGPTAAFKDFGARFLACSMERIIAREGRKLTILVATSGDTGGAVAAAFHGRRDIDVKVLFPKGRVSPRQQQQLTCWGGNVQAYEVAGTFDDCQKMVKDAFMDTKLSQAHGLSSANSINLGRLLPQSVYYVYASMYRQATNGGKKPMFVIPSGNVGNCTGAYWSMLRGAPISRIALAVNANTTIPDFLEEGVYRPRQSVATLANAMDVGAPSNMERLQYLFPDLEVMRRNVSAHSVSDEQIKQTITDVWKHDGYAMCPHTATAEFVRSNFFADEDAIVVSTASPAKFESVVEPLIGTTLPIPENLRKLLDKPTHYTAVGTDYHELFQG